MDRKSYQRMGCFRRCRHTPLIRRRPLRTISDAEPPPKSGAQIHFPDSSPKSAPLYYQAGIFYPADFELKDSAGYL